MFVAVGEVAGELVPESLLHGTPHALARLLLFSANGGSIGLLAAIVRRQYDSPQQVLWASLVIVVVVAVAYLFALGPGAGLTPSPMALVLVALVLVALRREAQAVR